MVFLFEAGSFLRCNSRFSARRSGQMFITTLWEEINLATRDSGMFESYPGVRLQAFQIPLF